MHTMNPSSISKACQLSKPLVSATHEPLYRNGLGLKPKPPCGHIASHDTSNATAVSATANQATSTV